ncbi:low-density lipoprotein receptor-related protein 11-like [Acipenser ruthenus]|uniref:low-density lipoprotein receptor-related protein 11-like n=1 Tax=Acipenser ruthenus TaxID=7906 RepID=UPI002741D7B7|nr:low-density lipoprotein receptor-related protein 11-like [Acipenser ruthenus]
MHYLNMPPPHGDLQKHRFHILCFALLWMGPCIFARSSRISDLNSQISGIEELLDEFRKQLQQDQQENRGDGMGPVDVCLDSFNAIEDYIIRAKDSIDSGATFLTAPGRIYSWRDCLHACCSDPHCTVAVVELERERSKDSLNCFLFNCTYKNRNVCKFSLHQGYSSYSLLSFNNTLYPGDNGADSDLTSSKHAGSRKGPPVNNPVYDATIQVSDEPPRSDAGQDVVLQLPTDWVLLDGRDSLDDQAITRYEWTLLQGDPSVGMKAPQPGVLKLTGLKEGSYHFQLTVTDTGGQKSSDNVTVTVLPSERKVPVCTGLCSRYQFMCDDGCCVDITFACDGKKQCLDGSDEAFCQSIEGSRKSVTHSSDVSQMKTMSLTDGGEYRTTAEEPRKTTMEKLQPSLHTYNREETNPPLTQGKTTQNNIHVTEDCLAPPAAGPCKGIFPRWFFDASTGSCKHFIYGGCKGNGNNFLQETDCINGCMKKQDKESTQNTIDLSSSINSEPAGAPQEEDSVDKGESVDTLLKADQAGDGHPVPESGAVLPLALGLAITALLLLMVACRLRLVRQKLKKARPITSEESDYLINGMYL